LELLSSLLEALLAYCTKCLLKNSVAGGVQEQYQLATPAEWQSSQAKSKPPLAQTTVQL